MNIVVQVYTPAQVLGLTDELNWSADLLDLLGIHVQLIIIQSLQLSNGAHDFSAMSDSLHNISSACLTLHDANRSMVILPMRDDVVLDHVQLMIDNLFGKLLHAAALHCMLQLLAAESCKDRISSCPRLQCFCQPQQAQVRLGFQAHGKSCCHAQHKRQETQDHRHCMTYVRATMLMSDICIRCRSAKFGTLYLIIAAPSATLRRASPRSRHPQTKGAWKLQVLVDVVSIIRWCKYLQDVVNVKQLPLTHCHAQQVY